MALLNVCLNSLYLFLHFAEIVCERERYLKLATCLYRIQNGTHNRHENKLDVRIQY